MEQPLADRIRPDGVVRISDAGPAGAENALLQRNFGDGELLDRGVPFRGRPHPGEMGVRARRASRRRWSATSMNQNHRLSRWDAPRLQGDVTGSPTRALKNSPIATKSQAATKAANQPFSYDGRL